MCAAVLSSFEYGDPRSSTLRSQLFGNDDAGLDLNAVAGLNVRSQPLVANRLVQFADPCGDALKGVRGSLTRIALSQALPFDYRRASIYTEHAGGHTRSFNGKRFPPLKGRQLAFSGQDGGLGGEDDGDIEGDPEAVGEPMPVDSPGEALAREVMSEGLALDTVEMDVDGVPKGFVERLNDALEDVGDSVENKLLDATDAARGLAHEIIDVTLQGGSYTDAFGNVVNPQLNPGNVAQLLTGGVKREAMPQQEIYPAPPVVEDEPIQMESMHAIEDGPDEHTQHQARLRHEQAARERLRARKARQEETREPNRMKKTMHSAFKVEPKVEPKVEREDTYLDHQARLEREAHAREELRVAAARKGYARAKVEPTVKTELAPPTVAAAAADLHLNASLRSALQAQTVTRREADEDATNREWQQRLNALRADEYGIPYQTQFDRIPESHQLAAPHAQPYAIGSMEDAILNAPSRVAAAHGMMQPVKFESVVGPNADRREPLQLEYGSRHTAPRRTVKEMAANGRTRKQMGTILLKQDRGAEYNLAQQRDRRREALASRIPVKTKPETKALVAREPRVKTQDIVKKETGVKREPQVKVETVVKRERSPSTRTAKSPTPDVPLVRPSAGGPGRRDMGTSGDRPRWR